MIDHRPKLILFAFALLISLNASAWTSWYIPNLDIPKITLKNASFNRATVYITGPGPIPGVDQEVVLEVPGFGKRDVFLGDLPKDWSFVHLKSLEKKIQISIKGSRSSIPAESGNQWSLNNSSFEKLALINLSTVVQTVHSNIKGLNGTLYPYELKELAVQEKDFNLKTEFRSALWGYQAGTWQPIDRLETPLKLAPKPGAYFRASNIDNDESFIVKLTDQRLIQAARDQIKYPEAAMPRMIIGQIAEGHGGHNRDLRSSKPSLTWSWHVLKVHNFSYFGSQECDGSPRMLEQILGPWLKKSDGICFWNYRVIEEVTPDQVANGS